MATALRQDIQQIRELASRIRGERDQTVGDLINRLHGINNQLNAAWDGASQTAFFNAYGDWIKQLEEFSNTMYNVEQYLVSVAQNFEDLDQAAAAAASGAATRT